MDKVKIVADGTLFDWPLSGTFQVDSAGEVVLGPAYGAIKISGLTRREAEEAVTLQLRELLKDPHVALVIDESKLENGIKGDHLVGADGTINLGTYGQVKVDGLSVMDARRAIEKQLGSYFADPKVSVDVKAYNSKVYYVILEGKQAGDSILRFPMTGNETLLDAIAQVTGIGGLSEATIWIARPTERSVDQIIKVDWSKALSGADGANPQVLPGDRIFIKGATLFTGDAPGGSYRPPPPSKSGDLRGGGDHSPSASSKSDSRTPSPPYVIEPPDILLVEATQLAPKEPRALPPTPTDGF